MSETELEAVVIVKCVGCKEKKEIREGGVAINEVPMCDKCFMPMVAVKAKIRKKK